jgi:hypothetical protein
MEIMNKLLVLSTLSIFLVFFKSQLSSAETFQTLTNYKVHFNFLVNSVFWKPERAISNWTNKADSPFWFSTDDIIFSPQLFTNYQVTLTLIFMAV